MPVASAPSGVPFKVVRMKTSKMRLKMVWDYPVWKPEEVEGQAGGTGSSVVLRALPRADAFAYIAKEDLRPILALRECDSCTGTDDALLSRTDDNEKTFLMARWFHCVKLPTHVLEENHPFRSTFAEDHPPHLFLASSDGNLLTPLTGEQSRTELWDGMFALLEEEYLKDAKKSLRDIQRLLDEYDTLDAREDRLLEQFEAEIEKRGPKSHKLAKIRKDIDRVTIAKKRALGKEAKVSDLGLKKAEKQTASL